MAPQVPNRNLRLDMRANGHTSRTLAQATELAKHTIDNIVYGQVKDEEKLALIRAVLQNDTVPGKYTMPPSSTPELSTYDGVLYRIALEVVEVTLADHNIPLTFKMVTDYTSALYSYAMSTNSRDTTTYRIFVEGIIWTQSSKSHKLK